MKAFIITACLASFIFTGNSQINNYGLIDRIALAIPASQTNTTADIAAYIKKHFDTDSKKVRAAYTWVASNISYSSDSIHPVIFEEDRDERIAITLRRRNGVCENYATLFNDICLKSGLRSLMIEGYTRQNGSIDKSPHAWCAVFIDNDWYLYDPTWDESRAKRILFMDNVNYEYFQVSPEVFIQSHMPFDPMFQVLNYPVTYNEFYNSNTQVNRNKPYFNYADSIAVYEKSNYLDKYLAAASRIEKNGTSSMVINKQKQLKMDIEIIRQDKDAALYNAAVADYNDALAILNAFINYRNNQFIPAKADEEIQAGFGDIEKKITAARLKLNEVNLSKAVLTLNTAPLEKVIDDLTKKVKDQQAFLKEYLSTAKEN